MAHMLINRLERLVVLVTANGGSFTNDLDASGVTHVIQHADDSRRYKQIHQASKGSVVLQLFAFEIYSETVRCRPVLKQIVTPDFIHDSLADGRLLDENGRSFPKA